MSELSRDEVVALVHPVDDATVAEIIATGVTLEEFKRACAFFVRQKKTHQPEELPRGPVGRAIAILERVGLSVRGGLLGEEGSTHE